MIVPPRDEKSVTSFCTMVLYEARVAIARFYNVRRIFH
jgi:hypothetical protein